MVLLYSAQNLLESELVTTIYATCIGRIELTDGVAILTYCHERIIGGLLSVVPQVIIARPTVCLYRDSAMMHRAFAREVPPVLAASSLEAFTAH